MTTNTIANRRPRPRRTIVTVTMIAARQTIAIIDRRLRLHRLVISRLPIVELLSIRNF